MRTSVACLLCFSLLTSLYLHPLTRCVYRISIPQNLIMKSIALRAIFIENFELVHLTSSSSFSKNSLPPEPQLAPQTHLDGLADPPETQLEEGWQRWEEDGMEEVEDAVVGGVVMVQCLNLPREPKKVGTWSMREEVEGGSGKAEEMPYPSIDPYTGQGEKKGCEWGERTR
eukprot:741934-Hanusia_phi.AAC.2